MVIVILIAHGCGSTQIVVVGRLGYDKRMLTFILIVAAVGIAAIVLLDVTDRL
jgi:hypothetical protein